jgi:hypothetical protein
MGREYTDNAYAEDYAHSVDAEEISGIIQALRDELEYLDDMRTIQRLYFTLRFDHLVPYR